MAKKKKVVSTSSTKKIKPTEAKVSTSGRKTSVKDSGEANTMLFKKHNFYWMLGGIGLIALGLLLMSGGSMPDNNTWDPDRIYSFRRITLAPIVILAGLGCQIVAIFKK